MYIEKIRALRAICPHCGSKIHLSASEYDKYRKDTEDYSGSTITCMDESKDGERYEVNYVNLNCPVCDHYIPLTVNDSEGDADRFGFKVSKHVEVFYDSSVEMNMDDYLKKQGYIGVDESSEI